MRAFILRSILVSSLLASAPAAIAAAPAPAPAAAGDPRVEALVDSLHPEVGRIPIAGTDAVLTLGKDYYFLPAGEAKRVLVEGWGNPPDSVGNVLGMVFPAGQNFATAAWGAVITFEATGYVPDQDAAKADYDAILEESRAGEEEVNAQRRSAGFPSQHLIGWAQAPSYNPVQHSLVWAREVAFEGEKTHTLNYDVRLLGRRGVLSLNMVAGMDALATVRAAAGSFSNAAAFEPGARYADYDPATDATADYGVAGLVAAGVGVTAAKKFGLLALLLAFGKKFIVLIAAAAVAGIGWFRRRLGARDEAQT